MGFTELKTWLRHRHPMVYLDRIVDYEPGEYITALMAVSGQIDAMSGHFPERAVYPASHLMQAVSQSAIILYQLSTAPLRDDEMTVVGSVKGRFMKPVVPGDLVVFHTTQESLRDQMMFFDATATVDGAVVGRVGGLLACRDVEAFGDPLW